MSDTFLLYPWLTSNWFVNKYTHKYLVCFNTHTHKKKFAIAKCRWISLFCHSNLSHLNFEYVCVCCVPAAVCVPSLFVSYSFFSLSLFLLLSFLSRCIRIHIHNTSIFVFSYRKSMNAKKNASFQYLRWTISPLLRLHLLWLPLLSSYASERVHRNA